MQSPPCSVPSLNLENTDYTNHSAYINSPRSLSLMKERGLRMEDLYFYNFYEYLQFFCCFFPRIQIIVILKYNT